jgi:RES domain-containing protein
MSGEGARFHGGRWNSFGKAVVYLCEEAALPVLEVLVHLDLPLDLLPMDYVLLRVDLTPLVAAAPDGWLEQGSAAPLPLVESRAWGDRWLREGRTPLPRLTSILVEDSSNLAVNVRHPLAAVLAPPATWPFAFGPRLLG